MKKSKKENIESMVNSANELFDNDGKKALAELLESQGIEVRICSKCHKIMISGYCIDDGREYYCSDECLLSEMSQEEYDELYDNGNGNSYWTEW